MTVYEQIRKNKRRSVVLVALFVAFLGLLGYAIGEYYIGPGGGVVGIGYALVGSVVMTLISVYSGDKLALVTAGAHQLTTESDNPKIWRMVENLCITAGLPLPKIHIIEDPAMNAFATGRNPEKASIALTTGLIENLEDSELEGVIAHELSHVKNYDTRLLMIVIVLVGSITLLADFMWRGTFLGFGGRKSSSKHSSNQIEIIFMVAALVLIVLSPIIAELIKLAISRKREFLADASAVLLTRYADGLSGALKKIGAQAANGVQLQRANRATAHLYLSNPFKKGKAFSHLFSTHPPIEERIDVLASMGGSPTASNK